MFKILIVDDEIISRKKLAYQVTQMEVKFSWIMEASSGEEAFDVVKDFSPNILITDIQMGEMSGLDLIEESLKIHPNLECIIVCGYRDFEYARRAINFKVSNYLLKPINSNELYNAIYDSINRINKSLEFASVKNDKDKFEKLILKNQVEQIINYKADTSMSLLNFPSNIAYYQIVIFRPFSFSSSNQSEIKSLNIYEKSDIKIIKYAFKNVLTELSEQYTVIADNYTEKHQIIMIITSTLGNMEFAKSKINNTIEFLKDNLDKLFLYDISSSNIDKCITNDNFIKARNNLDNRLLKDYVKIPFSSSEVKQNFYEFDKNIQIGEIKSAFEKLSKIFIHTSSPDFNIRLWYCNVIHSIIRKSFFIKTNTLQLIGSENINGSIIDEFENVDEMITHIQNLKNAIFEEWSKPLNNIEKIVKNITLYIKENYSEKLSTNIIAKKYNISKSYLCAVFNKLEGTTIISYLTDYRLKKSCELLIKTNLRITSVANNVGFENVAYYYKILKKTFGQTPSEYRTKKCK